MTIDELIGRLEDYRDEIGGDAEVRLMTQSNWPFENDIFGGDDKDYTNGVRLDYLTPRNQIPLFARIARRNLTWLTDAEDWYATFGIGQNGGSGSRMAEAVYLHER